jgi:acetyl esterase/lipase
MNKWIALLLMLTLPMTHSVAVYANTTTKTPTATQQQDHSANNLTFAARQYTMKTFMLNGQTIQYRAYEDIVYVSKPINAAYQSMNFYVPAAYGEGKSIGVHTAETAPIFFQITVGGYMPGLPGKPGINKDNLPNAIAAALSKGYVVASPGARGRTLKDEKGLYTGKAPACIVDLKAAVRYLRHNDKLMPGNAEKIISNGTSAGGALSSLLGATGNSADYEPYLKAIGAADEHDDIFAASCYCPITNLDHADAA